MKRYGNHMMNRHAPRSAMTLIEIMVALMIFTVVGGAMVTILLLATDIYRRGEYSRGANDEAIAVLGALNQDLDRLIPPSAGGWFYASRFDNSGNCLVAFTISLDTSVRLNDAFKGVEATNAITTNNNPNNLNATAVAAGNVSSWQIVAWWVNDAERVLYRDTLPWDPQAADPNTMFNKVRNLQAGGSLNQGGTATRVSVTHGCLHFGAWLSFDSTDEKYPRRRDMTSWEHADQPLPPTTSKPYDSLSQNSNDPPPPAPTAVRLSLSLTGGAADGGGRYAPQGRVIDDDGEAKLRVSGLKGLPLAEGTNYLRIDNEWIRYSSISGVNITCTTDNGEPPRGARRTQATKHGRGALAELGLNYAIVRSIGR